MILQGCALTSAGRFVAVWKDYGGKAIHVPLPKTVTDEVGAWIYSLDHYPTWKGVIS